MKKTGYVLFVAGVLLTVFTALDFVFFTQENVVAIGDLEINKRNQHSIPWSPFVGIAVMAVGASVYLLGSKRSILR